MPGTPTVAIVGGGCSGTLAAVHLLAQAGEGRHRARIVLVERTPDVSRGIAYRTTCDRHLLNVRAGDMSAFPHDPDDFVRWLRPYQGGVHAGSFVSRGLYGQYLKTVLREARQRRGMSFEVVQDHVIDIARRPGRRLNLSCAQGRSLEADAVVLAVGNFAPARPSAVSPSASASGRYLGDPWSASALSAIAPDATVMLLGSGLTAVDTALTLSGNGHRGPILALSRHGLLPESHRDLPAGRPATARSLGLGAPATSARDLLVSIRQQVAAAEASGGDWRSVIDGLRGESNLIWAGLPPVEQQRVLRHLRSYWCIHRHRMAPQVAQWIGDLRAAGQFTVRAGRLLRCETGPQGLRMEVLERASREATTMDVDYLVNCTGPQTDVRALGDPLLDSMLARGLARSGDLGMGLAVGADGAVIDGVGDASGRLWAIGSLRQGTDWETTAVPELRRQAATVAARLGPMLRLAGRANTTERDLGPYQEAV